MGTPYTQPPVTAQPPIVFVVDDDEVLRHALGSLLRSVGYDVREFSNPQEMIEHPLADAAGCLLLDVRLQGYSGFDVQLQLSESGSGMPIIFMTGHGDIPMSVRAMKAGAVDFFAKPFRQQDLLDSVAKALEAHRQCVEKQQHLQSLRKRFECLTPREKQVMTGVISGLLNKQIAGDLEISEITVKLHRANTMRKMCVATLADLVRAGQQLQLS
jgi:FixJ family two-component response regulator